MNERQKVYFERCIMVQYNEIGNRKEYAIALFSSNETFLGFMTRQNEPISRRALVWDSPTKAHRYMLKREAECNGYDGMHRAYKAFGYSEVDFSKYKVVELETTITAKFMED